MAPAVGPLDLDSTDNASEVFDLRDIALLLNYERASAEPRFRHTTLREVAVDARDFTTVRTILSQWNQCRIPRTGFVLERRPDAVQDDDAPDLPSTLLPARVPPALRALALTPAQIETYYWQIRNHDACFPSAALFQHLADLLPPRAAFRVRFVEGGAAKEYTTHAWSYHIVEMDLIGPRALTMAVTVHNGMSYITGGTPSSVHAVLGFAPPGSANYKYTILDLSSLQFGDVGRGHKGKDLFVLEPGEKYHKRLDKIAERNTFDHAKESIRINEGSTPNNEWLRELARRAKSRWDLREQVPWCGHCGAPPPRNKGFKRCSKCKRAWYCDALHQHAAWPFHKHFCEEPKPTQ